MVSFSQSLGSRLFDTILFVLLPVFHAKYLVRELCNQICENNYFLLHTSEFSTHYCVYSQMALAYTENHS